MSIEKLILLHGLRPADAVELVCPANGFPKHYAVYLGLIKGYPSFIANIQEGVKIIRGSELLSFVERYGITKVERHWGTDSRRAAIIRRAMSRIGEKEYHIIFNNCEHFKNWVLYGESKSHQVKKIAEGLFVTGAALSLIGLATKKKGLQKAGLIVMASPLIIVAIAFIIASIKKN